MRRKTNLRNKELIILQVSSEYSFNILRLKVWLLTVTETQHNRSLCMKLFRKDIICIFNFFLII